MSLHVVERGPADGLPVVLIHGFPFSHRAWDPQLEALSDEFRLVAYDLRGFGHSPVGDGQYTIEGFVDDLIELIEELRIVPVLCGLSMGGYIALRAIEREPERFRALVLCDTRSEADSNEGKLKRAASIAAVKSGGVAAFAESFLPAVFAPQSLERRPAEVHRIREIIETTSPLAICGGQLAMAARTDTTESLDRIAVPTLILVGEHDALTPPSDAEAMRGWIPDAELVAIPGAGHLPNLENPEAFNRALRGFLARIA